MVSNVRLLDYWSPPDGAGDPLACLATSFTFEADFFTQDCLARFLRLSTVSDEGDRIATVAALLEEEERLSEAQVTVVIDRSTPAEKRNLRWDLLRVHVPGGLLHAKVAVLIWERAARVVLGSANLTRAGYRRQMEIGLALDLVEGCRIPKAVFVDVAAELQSIVDLVPGPADGPKFRANGTLGLLRDRAEQLRLPTNSTGDLRLAVAPARPGVCPLDELEKVWRGAQPLRATVVSPFWDDDLEHTAVRKVQSKLTGRPAVERSTSLFVAEDPVTASAIAPVSLLAARDVDVCTFDPVDRERRALHAKLYVYESNEWLAAMVGSSNATRAGLGLARDGHLELNLWLGCRAGSKVAKSLKAMAREGVWVDPAGELEEQGDDEDEPKVPSLPLGFEACTLALGSNPAVLFEFEPARLPAVWQIGTPTGELLLDAEQWAALTKPRAATVPFVASEYPSFVDVSWSDGDTTARATWTVNLEDRGALPPPAELKDLHVDILLAALASSRPLPVALEYEMRRREAAQSAAGRIDLDPLHRFDDSGLLLQRSRRFSLALWELQRRLARPTSNYDSIKWRLQGAVGPLGIANGVVRAWEAGEMLAGEAQFLLAEIALTIAAVDWNSVVPGAMRALVVELVADTLAQLEHRCDAIGGDVDPGLASYIVDAFAEARA